MEPIPLSDAVDLDALDSYLLSERGPSDGMMLSDLDGFLTGLAAGPEVIPPEEWLPVIWGGEEPQFANEDEMRTVFSSIAGRYNEIIACLNADPEELAPIYWQNADGSYAVTDWAAGFLEAMALRPDAWEPLASDPEAQFSLLPLLMCGSDEPLEDEMGEDFDEQAFLADMPDVLPVCVADIHAFWRMHREPGKDDVRDEDGGFRVH